MKPNSFCRLGIRLAVLLALVAAASMSLVSDASAQGSRMGGTFAVSQDSGTHRFPGVAYDPSANAFLVVWNLNTSGLVRARYVSASGSPLSSQNTINVDGSTHQGDGVAVACGQPANVCLVSWIEERPYAVVGRLVRYSGGSVDFVSGIITINQNGVDKLSSAPPSVAYSSSSNEFLVAWTEVVGDVRAQRVNTSGGLAGGQIDLAVSGIWEGLPSATFNSALNEYVVGYHCEPSSLQGICARRVQPGSGVVLGGNTIFATTADVYPAFAYNSQQNELLAITWGWSGNSWMIHGQRADGSLQPIGGILSLAAFGGGDGIGLAYNSVSNTYLGVFQSQENGEVWGVVVGPTGAPGTRFQVTSSGTGLSPQPGAAASTVAADWLSVTVTTFTQTIGNMVQNAGGGTGGGSTGGTTPPPSGCTTVQPASNWTCVNGNWLPPTTGGTGSTSTGSCTTVQPAAGWTCVSGNWLPPTTGGTGSTGSCTTVQPASNWTCVNGNWLPPTTGGTGTTTNTSSCTTVQPASNWVCVSGNWLPPGSGGTTTTTNTSSCTTVQPASDWVCVSGNWLPPGSGGTTTTTNTSSCTTVQPASGWTCVSGNWLPPTSGSTTSSTSSCTTVQPGTGWVCQNGGWLPPGSTLIVATSSCTTVQPGAGWVCQSGNWLPPNSTLITSTTSSTVTTSSGDGTCSGNAPGAGWFCYRGNWLPPGYIIGG